MNYEDARRTCLAIADDMEADAKNFDGKPFNGRTVAEYFGNQGAAIAVLAKIVEQALAVQHEKEMEKAL